MTAPRRTATRTLIVALGVVAVVLVPAAVQAQTPDPERRSMTLDRGEVAPGDVVIASMVGLQGESLTLSVCGNLGKRGSVDCDNDSSVSDEVVSGDISYTQIVVQPPPAPCPCIVRAVANDTRDFMVAPITILGHPVAEVVSPGNEPLVEVTVEAQRAPDGLTDSLRSALGGRTAYEVTVTVRNVTTETLNQLALSGSVGNWADDYAAELELEAPASLEPGQTWTQDVVAEVTAPTVGTYEFEVVASGAGSSVTGTTTLTHWPVLLFLAAAILVLDIVWMAGRWIAPWLHSHDEDVEDLDDEPDGIDVIELAPDPAQPLPV